MTGDFQITWPETGSSSNGRENKMIYHFEYLPAGLFNRAQVGSIFLLISQLKIHYLYVLFDRFGCISSLTPQQFGKMVLI